MVRQLSFVGHQRESIPELSPCDHRTVSKDGHIICAKIVEGDNSISPERCRDCPFRTVNCAHLRFALRQITPSPLVVRHNGREEVWDDDPPEIRFERAACVAKMVPIEHPRACVGCELRRLVEAAGEQPRRRRRVAGAGKVVPFPGAGAVAATG
jgi:hypothetical protein